MTYENGVLIGLLCWLWYAVMIIVSTNSRLERNLNKVGMRHSWVSLSAKDMHHGDLNRPIWRKIIKYLVIVGFAFPFIFLSWIYVIFTAATVIYSLSKSVGKPQSVKELQWKLKNVDLTFDQIAKEMMKVNEEDQDNFEQFKENLLMNLQERGIYRAF